MALAADHGLMPADELIARRGVAEFIRRCPAVHRVARCAAFGHLAAVFILVAGETIRIQAKIGCVQILFLVAKTCLVRYKFGLVANIALQGAVFAQQLIAGVRVIKMIFAIRPPDQIIVLALMLHMARLALLMRLIGMQAFVGIYALFEQRMAIQTIAGADLLLARMAQRAVF